MSEVWLHSNRRALGMAMAPALAIGVVGMLVMTMTDRTPLQVVGGVLAALGAILVIGLANQLRRPRIAYRGGDVLFFLRAGSPVAVPAEVVESFFLGQGPAHLPSAAVGQNAETVNLVARLSQKSPEWARRDVKQALGSWCESYVTIRGAWCEPLNGELIRRLNRRLRELRDGRAECEVATPTAGGGDGG